MERGDLATIAAGIILVIVIALIVKGGSVLPGGETLPVTTPVPEIPTVAVQSPVETPTVLPATSSAPSPPARITYARYPLDYPNIRLPDFMETFGGSDIPWKDPAVVTFATMEGSGGGLSQEFIVPYPLWGMNITVESWTKPQYARFGMVLCTADDGTVLRGIEILHRGTAFRNVQVSGKPMYLIISSENVDRFRIDFITPLEYFNTTRNRISVKP